MVIHSFERGNIIQKNKKKTQNQYLPHNLLKREAATK